MSDITWRASSHSFSNGNCVQVAAGMLVRDSKDPDGAVLVFPSGAWERFTAALKARRPQAHPSRLAASARTSSS